VLNETGQTAFRVLLTGVGVNSANNQAILSEGGDSGLTLVARAGDPAPGTSPGVNFSAFSSPVLNGAGQTAFTGLLIGDGVNRVNSLAIFAEVGGSGLALVARTGDPAPDTAAGVNFGNLGDPVLNKAGQSAFTGSLTGPGVNSSNDRAIFSEGGGLGLSLVARTGDPAPGTSTGVNFTRFNDPVLNGAGQTAFLGFFAGAGVDSSNDRGLLATDPAGVLTLIARTGDLFDVDDDPLIDDLRTIASIGFVTGSGGEDGRPTSFNDAGQLAFRLGFTDGTQGIFVANTVAIPEPSSLLLALGASVLLVAGRWSRAKAK
jgi:hypothetical protein